MKVGRLPVIPLYFIFSGYPGLYTSPHLVAVRERIRVDGHPLSEEEFTKYFFEVWDKLEANPVYSCSIREDLRAQ
jgi:folylpolyglutamate synthase/dihydropteroate synthase